MCGDQPGFDRLGDVFVGPPPTESDLPREDALAADINHGFALFDDGRLPEAWACAAATERDLRRLGPVGRGTSVDQLHMELDLLLSRLAVCEQFAPALRARIVRRSLAMAKRSIRILGPIEGLYHWTKAWTQWTCIRRQTGRLRHNLRALELVRERLSAQLFVDDYRYVDTFELLYAEELCVHQANDNDAGAQVSATCAVELARMQVGRLGGEGRFLLARALARRAEVNWNAAPDDAVADLSTAQAMLGEMLHQGQAHRSAAYLDTCWRKAALLIDTGAPDVAEEVLEEGLLCHEAGRIEDTSYLAVHMYEAAAAIALERGAQATALLRAERGLAHLVEADRWSQMTLAHALGGDSPPGRDVYIAVHAQGAGGGDGGDVYDDQLRVVARELYERKLYRAARVMIDQGRTSLAAHHDNQFRLLSYARLLVLSHRVHIAVGAREDAYRDLGEAMALLVAAFDATHDPALLPVLGWAERSLAGLLHEDRRSAAALDVLRPGFARVFLALGDDDGLLWQTVLTMGYELAGLALETRQHKEAAQVGARLWGALQRGRDLDVSGRQDALYTLEAAALAHMELGEHDRAVERAAQGRALCAVIAEHTSAAWAAASLWQVEAEARWAMQDQRAAPAVHQALDALEMALDVRVDDHGKRLGQYWLPRWTEAKDGTVRARARALLGNIQEDHFLRCVSPPRAGQAERGPRPEG